MENGTGPEVKEKIHDLLFKTFRPEFLNRIDEIVMFEQLDKSAIDSIIKIQIDRLGQRLTDRKIKLEFDQKAMDFLCQKGYDPSMGARPVKRAIQTYVENPLARAILSGEIKENSSVQVSSDGSQLTFN